MFSFGVGGVWWVLFSSAPPSPQQTGISVDALKYGSESGRNPPLQAPKGRETHRDPPLAAFGILTVAAPGGSPGRQTGCGAGGSKGAWSRRWAWLLESDL